MVRYPILAATLPGSTSPSARIPVIGADGLAFDRAGDELWITIPGPTSVAEGIAYPGGTVVDTIAPPHFGWMFQIAVSPA